MAHSKILLVMLLKLLDPISFQFGIFHTYTISVEHILLIHISAGHIIHISAEDIVLSSILAGNI